MHPCAFFSHRLLSAERNYDMVTESCSSQVSIGGVAVIGWRVRGVPFIVWTDHKNLEYIRSAKRLNSGRLGGHCFSVVLSFRCPTVRVPRTSNLMHYLAFLISPSDCPLPSVLYLRDWWSPHSHGRSNRRFAQP